MDVTEQALRSLDACPDARLREIVSSLVSHLHAFAREVRLTPDEWTAGMAFLTATGQTCTPLRQEFYLLSDTLGLTMAVDEIAHGDTIARGGVGESLLVEGVVRDTFGKPIADALVEAWETDGDGLYDTQYADRVEPDYRGSVRADANGAYAFRAVKPVSYAIPTDGPVGAMLVALGRSAMRPAHLHIKATAAGKRPLITSLYTSDDPHLATDAVFGVRPSLVVEYSAGQDTRWAVQRDLVLADA